MKLYGKISATILIFVALTAGGNAAEKPQRPDTRTEQLKLIDRLLSDAPAAEKAAACKRLALIGDGRAVPALATLLPDAKLSSWARIALEAIPGPAADDALRTASGQLHGRLLVGAINSLGVRRDAKAVGLLVARLNSPDADAAAAAAVALGHIGGDDAVAALRAAINNGPQEVRSAAAEGVILCAERYLANNDASAAVQLYDEVRAAHLPQQRVLEATRGAILARGAAGVPLLVEQLRSNDKQRFNLGLTLAREFPGSEATAAIAAEVSHAAPQRQALLILALADRGEPSVAPLILKAAREGSEAVRTQALRALKRLDEAAAAPVLLDAALDDDTTISQTAMAVIDGLKGDAIDHLVAERLPRAQAHARFVLIELAGRRHIAQSSAALWKAADDSEPAVRLAALTALGGTIGPDDLARLVARLRNTADVEEAAATVRAAQNAAQRMPDREAAAATIAAVLPQVSPAVRCKVLEALASIGGKRSLDEVARAARSRDEALRDTAYRLLGEWMSVDAAPTLLELVKAAKSEKYEVRAVRAYIRLARQFDMPNPQRAEMCRTALEIARRPDDKRLVLEILLRYPSPEMYALALEAAKIPELKDEAAVVAMGLGRMQGGDTKELRKALAQAGHRTVKLEILKAVYGEGSNAKDVTAVLRKQARNYRIIFLPSASYNEVFGGDPSPGVVKNLTIRYRIDGREGEVTLAENATVVLPLPK